jgi:APA family basic amino acid/polyamine antiporter
MAQIGSALPASGGLFLVIRDVLSPDLGFIYQWILASMAAVVLPLVAIGFADYSAHFYPGINIKAVSLGVIVVFIGANYLGMNVASGIQNVLVVGFLIALLIFGLGGTVNSDPALRVPLFPNGYSPIVLAAVTAFFSYSGVFVIAEVAGEIKNPGRTIPRAIFLSFLVIIIMYVTVPFALTGVLSWEVLSDTNMAVVTASKEFMPSWLVSFIAIGALFATATSVNGIMMGLSRDFYKGAKSGMFPRYFAVIHDRFNTPTRAVLVIGMLALIGTAVGGNIVSFAQITVMSLMIVQVLSGIALWKLPKALPEVYRASPFRLGIAPLRIISVLFIAFSVFFFIVLAQEKPITLLIGSLFLAAGYLIYRFGIRPGHSQPGQED